MMTMSQAAARQVKWKQRAYRTPCGHLGLELERNEQGYLTENYVCNLCGESVAQGHLAA
jgi:predicted SprT family Zn-dependent metalloprotease